MRFFLTGIFTQSKDAIARIQNLLRLRESYRERLQSARTAARLLQVVDLLFARPVLTIRQVEAELEVDYPSARRYVDRLAGDGILTEVTGGSRNRIYRGKRGTGRHRRTD